MTFEQNDWKWNERAHPLTVNRMLDSVTELAGSAGQLPAATTLSDEAAAFLLRSVVRQMSVPMRKLCLEGKPNLLQRVVLDPMFLPVGGQKGKYSKATMSWKTPYHEWKMGFADGKSKDVIVPESQHEIQMGRLYGIEFQENGWCAIKSPFDETGRVMRMDSWLEAKILQVNSIGYTVKDALKLVADFEGAHASQQLPAIVAIGVKPDDMDRGARKRYRMANCIAFGCLTYVQLVVIYCGLFIVRMMQKLVQQDAFWKGRVATLGVAELIGPVKVDWSARGQIVNNCHEMIVVGKSDVPDARRQRPDYRIWSGCDDWDKPI